MINTFVSYYESKTMSKSSEAVKLWRKNTKQRMVDAMGGKCAICGYNNCTDALEFHHLDATEKEMGFGAVRGNPTSWSKIVEELKKCVLLCSNHHREIHAGVIQLPDVLPVFDDRYIVYKDNANYFDECPRCGKLKKIKNKFCSLSCSGKTRQNIDWEKYDLVEMKKTMSFTTMGEIIGVSDNSVSKRMRKLKMI